jgi:hypothetical protein
MEVFMADDQFIANSVSTADGYLEVKIRECIESESTVYGTLISTYSQTKYRFEISFVSRSQSGVSAKEYLTKVGENMGTEPLIGDVYARFMAKNDIGLDVSTTGTARVQCTYQGKVSVSATDSDQYDPYAGKETVPVHHKV